ncbi:WXG100 family type VII secretion target [Asanoa sp. WMMD1127]|uniref:WXG100 family type VII secretion target n=1 Tax=Asanoa sp. WMMD1127 TaxID=3016107 RepID=UPI002417C5CD|nr:WXG100 family type VII secretion target [Asanoa sp. WMMD1127]MDG4825401.1 WXG100 family type VII secretion target [Asanoa sp. WMMD1127]
MSDGIRVDITTLRAAATALGATGQQLATEVSALANTVDGSGNPWGTDEAGSLFGAAYVEVLTHALDVYQSMADQLLEAAENLDHGAGAYEAVEESNRQLFDRMELPGGFAAAR